MGRGQPQLLNPALSAQITIQRQVPARGIPSPLSLRRWALAALEPAAGELTIRLVDENEMRELNRRYRGKDRPTNVLSFPYDEKELQIPLLGDIVICAPVVAREAREQAKSVREHWAHMVIHGCLHILGYDHVQDSDAGIMESRERELLACFGISDPYGTSIRERAHVSRKGT